MQSKSTNQGRFLQRYLSLAPVLAILSVSIAFSIWIVINYLAPDILYYPTYK